MIELGFIIFLFYSNLLMGEFTKTNSSGKSLAFAIHDIFTITNFEIAVFSGLIGYVVFEYLSKANLRLLLSRKEYRRAVTYHRKSVSTG